MDGAGASRGEPTVLRWSRWVQKAGGGEPSHSGHQSHHPAPAQSRRRAAANATSSSSCGPGIAGGGQGADFEVAPADGAAVSPISASFTASKRAASLSSGQGRAFWWMWRSASCGNAAKHFGFVMTCDITGVRPGPFICWLQMGQLKER